MPIRRLIRSHAAALLLAAFIGAALARAQTAQAAGVVTDCTRQGLAQAMNGGSGSITFNCNHTHAPATITIAQTGGFNVQGSDKFSIDGGNIITLTGEDICRVFNLAPGGALTLSNILLTNGNAGNNYGGAVYVDHARLVLDHATIQNSHTNHFAGGAIFASGGEVVVQNGSSVQGNYNYDFGAINSTGAVTIQNSIIRNNTATVGGGALSVGGWTVIDNSQITGNTAQNGNGGGLLLSGSATMDMVNSLVASNIATGTASSGGGIYSLAAINLTRVTLSANSTISEGGGLFAGNSTFIQDSTLNGNTTSFYFGGGGGGIYNQSPLTLIDVTLSGNHSRGDGGGLLTGDTVDASVLLSKTTFTGNTSGFDGGGMANHSGMANGNGATIQQSVFASNQAQVGGGLMNDGAAEIQDTTFDGNSTTSSGGGIMTVGSLSVDRVTLLHNASYEGAGLFNSGRTNLINVTVSGNTAATWGGGIYNTNQVSLLNVTLSDNAAGTSGGALYNDLTSVTALTNTIVANSRSGGNCAGKKSIDAAKYSIDSDNTCGLLVAPLGPGNLHADPKLSALGNYGGPLIGADHRPTLVHMPETGSPAIDGVAGSDAPATDERGVMRPQNGGQGGGYDIGAVERRQPGDSDLAPRLFLPLLRR